MGSAWVCQRWAAPLNAQGGAEGRRARNARTSFGALRNLRQSSVRFLLALIIVAAGCGGQTHSHTMKNQESPTTAGHWMKRFNDSSLYRHDPGTMFDDYHTLTLCALANQRQEERYLKVAKRYKREELETIADLFAMHILIHEHQTAEGGWYDMLGEVYMEMASRSKTSRMGQFFTPASLCDVAARMTIGDPEDAVGKRILDPAVGSGRMLLAVHALQPRLELVAGADLDPICAKMCTLNFWLHGIRGEVAHMDSLSLKWYSAWQTHPRLSWPFVTWLDDDRREESVLYVDREAVATQATQPTPPAVMDLFNQPGS